MNPTKMGTNQRTKLVYNGKHRLNLCQDEAYHLMNWLKTFAIDE